MRRALTTALIALIALPCAAYAAPFDPEAATNTYLATLNGAARAKSDAYFEGGYWLILWGALIAILSDGLILHFGLSRRFRDWAERVTKRRWLQPALYAFPYLVAGTLISLPWTIYTQFIRENQYDLMNQTLGAWAFDQAKGLGIGLVIIPLMVMAVFVPLRRFPRSWWLWATGGTIAFTAFFAMIAPVFLAPLFNTYTELKPGPVRDRIVAMAKSRNIPAEHIYVFDASKQTKRVSANVSGLGPTIRISLNDNLLNRTTLPEQAAVMGHEMGHYVLNHVAKSIFALSLIFVIAFWSLYKLTPMVIHRYGERWGVRGMDDPAAIPIYAILFSVFFFLLTPVTNSISRIQESEADAFGLDVSKEPDGEALVDLKLAEYRKMDPGPIEEILLYDHPSGRARIRMAMDWKAKHLAEAKPLAPTPAEPAQK